jgi:hypothetical protein
MALTPVIPKKKYVKNYLNRLHELMDNEQDFTNLTQSSTFISLSTLSKLGIDIIKDFIPHGSQSELTLDDIDDGKLINIIKREKRLLKRLSTLYPGYFFLIRLQERLINALLSLLYLLNTPGASADDIHRLIIKIAALSREVSAQVYQLEMLQRHYAELEMQRNLEMQERVRKIYATPQDKKEKHFKLKDIDEEEKPSPEEEAFAKAFKAIFEVVLTKTDPNTQVAYNNRFVSLPFEAKLQSFCNELGFQFEKRLDGHVFLIKTNKEPSSSYKVTFAKEGVHFASQTSTQYDLDLITALIELHDTVFDQLELSTQWTINAKNTTQAMKAMSLMQSFGANMDALVQVNVKESIGPTPLKLFPTKAKKAKKPTDPHLT